jgi:hypothetical protein
VDAKKKELVGDFKNAGREWCRQGEPEQVRVYDFPITGLGRVTPYGVYDQGRNVGWVNVGIDHDTAAFAVESIRRWWNEIGKQQYPEAKRLFSYAVILTLIAATTTEAGLTVQCQLDTNTYSAGRKVSDEDMALLSLVRNAFHGEWNYTILPPAAST